MNAIPLPSRQTEAGPDAAHRLAALVRETQATGIARQALLLRLSRLPGAGALHRRLAVEALAPLTLADRARLFLLPDGDAALVWRGAATRPLAEATARLATLFADSGDGLARHLALPEQAETLLAAIAARPDPPPAAVAPRAALDLAALAALEAALDGADLARFARRRAVCALSPGRAPAPAWEIRHFSLAELADTLAPDRDLKAEPSLFRRLTRALDARMLALLAAPRELDGAGPFGLNLNIDSLLAPGFLRFDAALPVRLRGRVVLALRPDDALADPPAFLFARGFAQARGYRVMLAGLTRETAAAFPADALGVDHRAIAWHPALPVTPDLVLTGVDTAEALDWAHARGVAHATGALLRPRR